MSLKRVKRLGMIEKVKKKKKGRIKKWKDSKVEELKDSPCAAYQRHIRDESETAASEENFKKMKGRPHGIPHSRLSLHPFPPSSGVSYCTSVVRK